MQSYSVTRLMVVFLSYTRNQGVSLFSRSALFKFLDRHPREAWHAFLRSNSGFGNKGTIVEAQSRGLDYLFKLRQNPKVKYLLEDVIFTIRLEQRRSRLGRNRGALVTYGLDPLAAIDRFCAGNAKAKVSITKEIRVRRFGHIII